MKFPLPVLGVFLSVASQLIAAPTFEEIYAAHGRLIVAPFRLRAVSASGARQVAS